MFKLGNLLPMATTSYNIARFNKTERIMFYLRDGLYGYAIINERLPCADTNDDGIEDCPNLVGTTPYQEIGVDGFDTNGKLIKYEVDSSYIGGIPYPSSIVTPAIIYTTVLTHTDSILQHQLNGFILKYKRIPVDEVE